MARKAPASVSKVRPGETRGQRDYRVRQWRAKQEGFSGDYERRTRDRPGASRPAPEELARRRGHRAGSDLETLLRAGRVERLSVFTTRSRRGVDEVTAIAWLDDGSTREFTVKGGAIDRIGDTLGAMGTDAPALEGSPPGGWKFGGGGGDDDLDYDELEEEIDLEAEIPF